LTLGGILAGHVCSTLLPAIREMLAGTLLVLSSVGIYHRTHVCKPAGPRGYEAVNRFGSSPRLREVRPRPERSARPARARRPGARARTAVGAPRVRPIPGSAPRFPPAP